MDDHWENEVTEYWAVNITGFRIVDNSRKTVKDFLDGLRRIDPRFKGTVSKKPLLIGNQCAEWKYIADLYASAHASCKSYEIDRQTYPNSYDKMKFGIVCDGARVNDMILKSVIKNVAGHSGRLAERRVYGSEAAILYVTCLWRQPCCWELEFKKGPKSI